MPRTKLLKSVRSQNASTDQTSSLTASDPSTINASAIRGGGQQQRHQPSSPNMSNNPEEPMSFGPPKTASQIPRRTSTEPRADSKNDHTL